MCLVLLILVVEEAWVVELLHEGLRRLIHVHISHLAGGLLSSCLLLFFLLFLLLDLLELVKDILVVKKRM